MNKILKQLGIWQTRKIKCLTPLGKDEISQHRLNPYNPLTYIILPICIILGLIVYGVWGFWNEMYPDLKKYFGKWE